MSTPDDTHPFDPPLALTEDDVLAEQLAAVREIVPDFRLLPGQGYGHLLRAAAAKSAEAREAFVALMVFRLTALLANLHGIEQLAGTPAVSTVTVRASDTIGHQLDEGTTVFLGQVALELAETLTIPAGQTSASADVQTTTPGAGPNGATGTLELDEPQAWIASTDGVTLDAPLADGTDPEDDVAFAKRLADELTLQTGTPIKPRDFALIARRYVPDGFAWPVNLYDADTGTPNVPGHITVVVADAAGEALGGPSRALIRDVLQAESGPIVGISAHVVGPTYTPIDFVCTVQAEPGWNDDAVEFIARQTIAQALSPAGWIERIATRDTLDPPASTVHAHQVIARIAAERCVRNVPTLTVNGGSTVALDSLTGLPRVRSIQITVVAEAAEDTDPYPDIGTYPS